MARRSNGNPIPTAIRVAVDLRDDRRCVRCGLASRAQHHRTRRRDGGHPVEGIVSLCNACHATVHAEPTKAKVTGYIVPPWGPDPADVPLLHYSGQWLRFQRDGSAVWCDPPQEVA